MPGFVVSRRRWFVLVAVAAGCVGPAAAADLASQVQTEKAKVRIETVVGGLSHPWGLAFLPDGRALVTERPGRLRLISREGALGPAIDGVPKVDVTGQGGLLDVAPDPDFERTSRIFLSYAEPRGDGKNGTTVASARLATGKLDDVKVIFRQEPAMTGGHHFGSRLVFDRGKNLFVTLGDRNIGRAGVQKLDTDLGKVVRIDRDGRPPSDNPFLRQDGARAELWSLGHRNVQGAALDPATGELWTDEHGPKGGDELNRTLGGRNYGWPLVTFGTEYSGAPISDKTAAPGFEPPVHHWVPSIGTSGLAFYGGGSIPEWRGNVFVGGLASRELVRLELRDGQVAHEERLLGHLKQRIRTVVDGPDGALYVLTDEDDGRVLRITAAR